MKKVLEVGLQIFQPISNVHRNSLDSNQGWPKKESFSLNLFDKLSQLLQGAKPV
jgi:hypothetical protein